METVQQRKLSEPLPPDSTLPLDAQLQFTESVVGEHLKGNVTPAVRAAGEKVITASMVFRSKLLFAAAKKK